MQDQEKFYIGGDWVAPSSADRIAIVSPHSEEVIARVPEAKQADVDRAVAAARQAFDEGPWPRMTAAERADVMERLLLGLQVRDDAIATCISREMGTPITVSRMAQSMASAMVLNYYVGLARTYEWEQTRPGLLGPVIVRREPVGVAAAVCPWNFPLFTAMLKLGPALAAGCTVVLKPSPETSADPYILAEAAAEAGLPPGVLNIVAADREVSEYLVRHPGVDKVGFTGSTAVGRRIGAICGEQLKRCTLELGGKSAAIILDDADLAMTIPQLMGASFLNSGQACGGQTRVLASKKRYREVRDALAAAVAALRTGDPLDETTEIGPMVAKRQQDRVLGYIDIGRKEGAKVAVGGGRPASLASGWYVEPTLFVDVDNRSRIAQEEIFGPVVCLIAYEDEADAVRIANDSAYGLSGTVWSGDVAHATDVARQVRTGTLTVNGFILDFGSPFGGYKCSGIGREMGPEGLEAYLEAKSIALMGM